MLYRRVVIERLLYFCHFIKENNIKTNYLFFLHFIHIEIESIYKITRKFGKKAPESEDSRACVVDNNFT